MKLLDVRGSSVIDVWGEVGKNFDISVNVVKIVNNQVQLISFTPYYSTTVNNPNIVTTLQDSDTTNPVDVTQIAVTTETNSINQKPHASIFINNSTQDDNNHYILFEIKSSNGTVNQFFIGVAIFTILATGINWWFYNRKNCEKPS